MKRKKVFIDIINCENFEKRIEMYIKTTIFIFKQQKTTTYL